MTERERERALYREKATKGERKNESHKYTSAPNREGRERKRE